MFPECLLHEVVAFFVVFVVPTTFVFINCCKKTTKSQTLREVSSSACLKDSNFSVKVSINEDAESAPQRPQQFNGVSVLGASETLMVEDPDLYDFKAFNLDNDPDNSMIGIASVTATERDFPDGKPAETKRDLKDLSKITQVSASRAASHKELCATPPPSPSNTDLTFTASASTVTFPTQQTGKFLIDATKKDANSTTAILQAATINPATRSPKNQKTCNSASKSSTRLKTSVSKSREGAGENPLPLSGK